MLIEISLGSISKLTSSGIELVSQFHHKPMQFPKLMMELERRPILQSTITN